MFCSSESTFSIVIATNYWRARE